MKLSQVLSKLNANDNDAVNLNKIMEMAKLSKGKVKWSTLAKVARENK